MHLSGVGDHGCGVQCNRCFGSMFGTYGAAVGRRCAQAEWLSQGIWMLVTDKSWAECNPGKRALMRPYEAWRCVGWTNETLNFFAVASREQRERDLLPDGLLISGPEALLEMASQWEPGSFSVYVLDRAVEKAEIRLCQVTGIWREREAKEGGEAWLWYSTSRGELKPCSPIRVHLGSRSELVSELAFDDSRIVAEPGC